MSRLTSLEHWVPVERLEMKLALLVVVRVPGAGGLDSSLGTAGSS